MAAAQDYIACRFADKQVFYHLSNERAHVIEINVTDDDGTVRKKCGTRRFYALKNDSNHFEICK